MPSGRIGEVLAEVDTHVADTAEDPASAFGAPKEYAARIAEEAGATPQADASATRRLLTGVPGTAGTLLAVEGVVGLVRDRTAPVTLAVLLTALRSTWPRSPGSPYWSCCCGSPSQVVDD